jgi:hypothetical protein
LKIHDSALLKRLGQHRRNLPIHFEKASSFLVKCQIIEPYVEKGMLHGCVCPWEIGESAEEGAFPILEDFHDTLEAIWVWSYYTKASHKQTFKPNIDWAWEYIVKNWNRFIGKDETANKSLYDCSYVLFSGTLYEKVFNDYKYEKLVTEAGNRLEKYLIKLKSTEAREYYDPFWMTYCLSLAAKSLKKEKWLKTAEKFAKETIANTRNPFSKIEKEPQHKGPGGHDFFSKNANKALATISCLNREKIAKEIITEKFLPILPRKFVSRHADENAWNAHLATAISKSYVFTGNEKFLSRYFVIMKELEKRDKQKSAALPRAPASFSRRESWVTFFYAHAYASVI